jgi:hypothetical protein
MCDMGKHHDLPIEDLRQDMQQHIPVRNLHAELLGCELDLLHKHRVHGRASLLHHEGLNLGVAKNLVIHVGLHSLKKAASAFKHSDSVFTLWFYMAFTSSVRVQHSALPTNKGSR